MNETLLTALQYYGAGAALIAALVVSLDLGRRITGWACARQAAAARSGGAAARSRVRLSSKSASLPRTAL
jgi:hypothetical protein